MFFKSKFIAPMSGVIKDITEMNDDVFSSKSMGDGVMIEFDGDHVVAPFDATVIAVYPTGHAFGLKGQNGVEVMIHIGIDTFELGLDYFDLQVQQGDVVKQGDVLVNIKSSDIIEKGLSSHTAIIFTSGEHITVLKPGQKVAVKEKRILKYN